MTNKGNFVLVKITPEYSNTGSDVILDNIVQQKFSNPKNKPVLGIISRLFFSNNDNKNDKEIQRGKI